MPLPAFLALALALCLAVGFFLTRRLRQVDAEERELDRVIAERMLARPYPPDDVQ